MSISRRLFLGLSSSVFVSSPFATQSSAQSASLTTPVPGASPATTPAAAEAQKAPAAVADAFPSHPPGLVREMVIAAHGRPQRVVELVARWPALARAAIDWGYGDWEDALGAASHVGRRDIAELLIGHGARPTIFSAAMLGQLDVVRAFISASPGIEAIHGPHSITLLRHAVAGGAAAQPVADYLRTLPASDRRTAAVPIAPADRQSLAGAYAFGLDGSDRLVVAVDGENLSIARPGRSARTLIHLGERAFYPAGAPGVRVRFNEQGSSRTVSVFDPDLVVVAERVS